MDVVLPGKKLALNIFEPRYRLMTRRVMEGNRKFGMVSSPRGTLGRASALVAGDMSGIFRVLRGGSA